VPTFSRWTDKDGDEGLLFFEGEAAGDRADADLFLDVMAVEGEALEEDFFATDFGTVLFFGDGDFLVLFRLFWGDGEDEDDDDEDDELDDDDELEDELEEEDELGDDELVDPLSAYL
jgi:hypothetical protein